MTRSIKIDRPAMLAATSIKIEIPVEDLLGAGPRTPDSLAAEKRHALSTPRTPKSPEALRKAEVHGALLAQFHVDAVQARAARENQRAAEAVQRRLRAEAGSRQRLQSRFNAVAKRNAFKGEEKKQAVEKKASLRVQRADEARLARSAIEKARTELLASASERVEESARRAAVLVKATAIKNAHITKHALAVVAAHKEQRRAAAEATSTKLAAQMFAATERRNDVLEAVQPRAAMGRMEMAKAELARRETERLEKKRELERSIFAATERRESSLGSVVERARADLARVQAAHEAKAWAAAEAVEALAVSRRGKHPPPPPKRILKQSPLPPRSNTQRTRPTRSWRPMPWIHAAVSSSSLRSSVDTTETKKHSPNTGTRANNTLQRGACWQRALHRNKTLTLAHAQTILYTSN